MSARTARPLDVAFLDQVGATAGGAEETLATFLGARPHDIAASAVLFEDGAFAQRLRELGLPVAVVPIPARLSRATREHPSIGAALQLPAIALRVARLVRARRAQLVYTNSVKAHLVGAAAARLAGVPCVMHFHDVVEGAGLSVLRAAARLAARERIACSRVVASALGIGATTVIYGPVELSAYRTLPSRTDARRLLGLPLNVPLVSIVGRINRWKGHDRFLRIAARVARDGDAHFAIVGAPVFRDADYVPELHALIARLGLRDRVTFVPWLDDVRTIYAASDVNCNCSSREPFGRSVVEAAACGVPSVCFDDSGAAEIVRDGSTGRVVRAGDETAFAEAVSAYLCDPVRRRTSADAARADAVRFDAHAIAEQMSAVIRRAAA